MLVKGGTGVFVHLHLHYRSRFNWSVESFPLQFDATFQYKLVKCSFLGIVLWHAYWLLSLPSVLRFPLINLIHPAAWIWLSATLDTDLIHSRLLRPISQTGYELVIEILWKFFFFHVACHDSPAQLPYTTWSMRIRVVWSIIIISLPHIPWIKWPPFRRRYFQMHFREWQILYFD